jgi:hypothetical protein
MTFSFLFIVLQFIVFSVVIIPVHINDSYVLGSSRVDNLIYNIYFVTGIMEGSLPSPNFDQERSDGFLGFRNEGPL